jgi:hypothetical protein
MNPRLLLLAAALVTASGCAAKAGNPEAAERPKYTFPHATHVDAGLACTTCHAGVAQAKAVGPKVHVELPAGDAAKDCLGCHDKGVPAAPPPRRV